MVPSNSTPGGLHLTRSKSVGIIAIKTERTQIHFLSDVLVAVASLDLKVPMSCEVTTMSLLTDGIISSFMTNFQEKRNWLEFSTREKSLLNPLN